MPALSKLAAFSSDCSCRVSIFMISIPSAGKMLILGSAPPVGAKGLLFWS